MRPWVPSWCIAWGAVLVSLLCVGQFVWTLFHERAVLTAWNVGAALLGVVLFLLVFQDMQRLGRRLERRARARDLESGPQA